MRRVLLSLMAITLGLAGCDDPLAKGTGLVLLVESCDDDLSGASSLEVTIESRRSPCDAPGTERCADTQSVPLDGEPFPVALEVDIPDDLAGEFVVTVRIKRDSEVVARDSREATVEVGRLTQVSFQLDCALRPDAGPDVAGDLPVDADLPDTLDGGDADLPPDVADADVITPPDLPVCEEGIRPALCGQCVDLFSDQDHCGECDYSCEGQPCMEGVCLPIVVGRGPMHPVALALDTTVTPTLVRWTSAGADPNSGLDGEIWKAGKDGLNPAPVSDLDGMANPVALVIANGSTYYVERGELDPAGRGSVGLLGGIELDLMGSRPTSVAVEGQEVYVLSEATNAIMRYDRTLMNPPTPIGSPTSITPFQVSSLLVTERSLYWVTRNPAQILRLSRSAGAAVAPSVVEASELVGRKGAQPQGLAVRGIEIFWLEDDYSLYRFTIGGETVGDPAVEGRGNASCNPSCGIASDAEFVYYTETDAGTVRQFRADGEEPRVLAQGLAKPVAVASDGVHVFIAEDGTGDIHRVRRRP